MTIQDLDQPIQNVALQENVGTRVRRIVKRERDKHDDPVTLAFVMNGRGRDQLHRVTVVQWSDAAYHQLIALARAMSGQKPKVSLPVVSLRGRLELGDHRNLRLDRTLGLAKHRTLSWTLTPPEDALRAARDAALGWLVDDVTEHAHHPDVVGALTQLKGLVRGGQALTARERSTRVFDWGTSLGKTAKALTPSSYADLADFVARGLEGQTPFPDLGPLRRIASGQLEQNQAELLAEPVSVGRGSRFSLVVRIRVFSYPGRPTPVIVTEFSKRVWATGLKEKATTKTLSAYALPDGSTRALQFTLKRVRTEAGSVYVPDDDFGPIARQYFPETTFTAEKIVKDGHRLPGCRLLVGLKHGVGERSETKSGVPDKDKLDGFTGLREAMKALGLHPWEGLRLLESSTREVKDRDQHWGKRDSDDSKKQDKYRQWLEEAQQSIRDVYNGQHHLVIAVQPGHEEDAREAEARLTAILGGSITTLRVPISPLAHGPRSKLPAPQPKTPDHKPGNADRAALRLAEWDPFIRAVKAHEEQTGRRVDGVLVIARQWYSGNQHDDLVNKRAARIAIAQGLGVPVQYLRPRDEAREEAAVKAQRGRKKTQDEIDAGIDRSFEDRLMIGWLDLAYKSAGRVKPGKVITEAKKVYEEDVPSLFCAYPDRILALGVVRRNTSRFIGNDRSFLPFAIELDVETGTCSARFAYEGDGRQPVHTSLMPLPQALVTLAGLGPVQLTTAVQNRWEQLGGRTQAFFREALADFGKRAQRPLVIVDADSSRSVWPWLKDEVIDPNNVHLDGTFHAEAAWPRARLVRVRTQNTPKVLWDKHFHGAVQGEDGQPTDEIIRYHAPSAAEADLFKLTDTQGTNVYLSFGSTIRTKQTQGRSGYRALDGMKQVRDDAGQYFVADTMKVHTDAWTTPAGVEIVVVRAGGDQPDQVARLVEWLRQCYAHFGEWTTKPAPLYFERALKEYLADYDLDEEEGGEEGE